MVEKYQKNSYFPLVYDYPHSFGEYLTESEAAHVLNTGGSIVYDRYHPKRLRGYVMEEFDRDGWRPYGNSGIGGESPEEYVKIHHGYANSKCRIFNEQDYIKYQHDLKGEEKKNLSKTIKVRITDPEAIKLIKFDNLVKYLDASPLYNRSEPQPFGHPSPIGVWGENIISYDMCKELMESIGDRPWLYWEDNRTLIFYRLELPNEEFKDHVQRWGEIITQLAFAEVRSELDVWSDITDLAIIVAPKGLNCETATISELL